MSDDIKLLLSFVLSSLLGLERQIKEKPAGLRTHILVGVSSTLLSILSYKYFGVLGADPARLTSYALTAIGFIGAGTIIKEENKVIGLTTAASLFLTSSIGIAIGVGAYKLAIFSTLLGLISLIIKKLEKYLD